MNRSWIALAALLLSACGARIVPLASTPMPAPAPASHRPVASTPAPVRQPVRSQPMAPVANPGAVGSGTNAAGAGLVAGPAIAGLRIDPAQAAKALAAFRLSCRELMRRSDLSGLTRGGDWQPACTAANSARDADAPMFFAQWLEAIQVGDGKAFATGYYVPEILGSRDRRPGYDVPIYGRPSDLIDIDLGKFSDTLKGKSIRGRVEGKNFVPYYDRTQIEQGAMTTAPVIAWAADPVALFFVQVQGSGVVRQPDGSTFRIGYATQNGRDYTGIGAWMRDRGLLQPGRAAMQDIDAYLHANPAQGVEIMRANRSYVFFRLLEGPPLGAMGLPVAGGVTVAADPRFIPLGAPVFLSMDRADANGLWIAQDTGGAIKGANRIDTFWGAGREAEAIAGGMSARGTAFVLVPIGTLARLQGWPVAGRRLSADETALWARVMATVTPLDADKPLPFRGGFEVGPGLKPVAGGTAPPPTPPLKGRGLKEAPGTTLDGSWDRKLSRGSVEPDATVDLHGHTLTSAHSVLDRALDRSRTRGDRVILLITGKPPRADSERPHARGAIRAVVGDWLHASRHADAIAAVRAAAPRHGGSGALYIILRRPRLAPKS